VNKLVTVEREAVIGTVRIECVQFKDDFRDFCGLPCSLGVRIARKLSSCGGSD